jgi:hypothetical protein
MIITKELLEVVKTKNGGYTKNQQQALGFAEKVKSGWLKQSIGITVNNNCYRVLFWEMCRSYKKCNINYPPYKPFLYVPKKGKENTDKDTWEVRGKRLSGEMTYAEYLKSDSWRKIKERYKRKAHLSSCKFCGTKNNIHLHHLTYRYLFTKYEMRDIIPLCAKHHQEVHDFSKANNLSVINASRAVSKKYGVAI